ncbi:MAG TPA: hypothetical protein VGC95_10195 [Chitinophagaceae bacterium]|jgi:hypothetical protein
MNCEDLNAEYWLKNAEADRKRNREAKKFQKTQKGDAEKGVPHGASANENARWRFVVHDKIWYWERDEQSGVIRKGAFASYIACVTDAEKNGFDSEVAAPVVTKRDIAPPAQ